MLTTRSKIVEKILHSPEGVAFKVLFLVYEECGEVKAKIVSATAISIGQQASQQEDVISLPYTQTKLKEYELIKSTFIEAQVSPYFDLLSFFVSQPTRAPARV